MEIKNKNWLITGGCGFIGTSLIAHLLKNRLASRIRVLDNLSVGTREDLAEVCGFMEVNASHLTSHEANGVELLVGDIRDPETCLKACEEINVVVHLAANTGVGLSVENPRADMESNVLGIFNMLEASRQKGIEKFIFASSSAPIGEVEPPITEDKPAKPVSPYGASKLAGEGYCSAYFRTYGVKTVTLRFGNVYGPRSKHKGSIVAKFFKLALAGHALEIYGDGNQTRDFIYIDDLVDAICFAIEPAPLSSGLSRPTSDISCINDPYGEIFQIATHKETTINEIAEKIREILLSEIGTKVNVIHGNLRLGDVKRNFSDISKAKSMLGWAPKVGLGIGLRKTFEYFV